MGRPSFDEYFLGIAEAVAQRSDCERSKVGAVVVKDRRIRATGYNGAPSGFPGCSECPRRASQAVPGADTYSAGKTRCVAIHAEANALLYCDRADLSGSTIYVTRRPCYDCAKLIAGSGVETAVFKDELGVTWRLDIKHMVEDVTPFTGDARSCMALALDYISALAA